RRARQARRRVRRAGAAGKTAVAERAVVRVSADVSDLRGVLPTPARRRRARTGNAPAAPRGLRDGAQRPGSARAGPTPPQNVSRLLTQTSPPLPIGRGARRLTFFRQSLSG